MGRVESATTRHQTFIVGFDDIRSLFMAVTTSDFTDTWKDIPSLLPRRPALADEPQEPRGRYRHRLSSDSSFRRREDVYRQHHQVQEAALMSYQNHETLSEHHFELLASRSPV